MIYIVAFSGGKDSVAMVLKLLDMGVSKENIHLHHHDIDGGGLNIWDWPCTESYCKAFAEAFGLQLFFSYRKGGIDAEMHRQNCGLQSVMFQKDTDGNFIELLSKEGFSTRLKFPAVSANLTTRWCSSCVKISVMSRVIPQMYNDGNFTVCTGERREESANRAKYKEFEPHPTSTKNRGVMTWRCVIDYTEAQVWALFEKYKVQPHPCYELGYPRCSCQICIFGSSNIWASNYQLSPHKIEYIAQKEREFGFTLFNGMTIYDKVNKGESFLKSEKVERWASEALSVFKSPIFVDEWQLPQGAFVSEKAGSL